MLRTVRKKKSTEAEIWMMDADGQNARLVFATERLGNVLGWSGDSKFIYFEKDELMADGKYGVNVYRLQVR